MIKVEREPTSTGFDTLVVDGRYFHSRVNPRKEASRAASAVAPDALALILSPGLGYLADALKPRDVISVERHPQLAVLRPDLNSLVHPSCEELERLVETLAAERRPKIAVLTGAHREEDHEYYESLRKAITRALEKSVERILTTDAFAKVWERNLRANVMRILQARNGEVSWSSALEPRLRGSHCVLLSAGPTLGEELPLLSKMLHRGKYLILVVDSALPAALSAGISPDLVFTIDPQPVKAAVLSNLEDIPLVASVLSPPEILARAGRLYLFGQGHPMEPSVGVPLAEMIQELGGSVATAAATIAVRHGAATLVLAGQDLAFIGDRTHVRGAAQEAASAAGLERFSTMEHAKMRTMIGRNLRCVPSVADGMVMTTPVMDSYRIYLERLARDNPGTRFVHTSSRGARMAMPHLSLAEWLNEFGSGADKV